MEEGQKYKLIGCLALVSVIAFFILVAVIYVFGTWSALVVNDQNVKQAMGNVQADLQRRADLIPNLVNTVKGYASHEKDVFVEVTQARSQVGKIDFGSAAEKPEVMAELIKQQQQLSGALSKLLVVVEKYPELKANENFRDLQAQLEGTENRIGVSRKRYNDAIKPYNILVHGPISHFIANMQGYHEYQYYQGSDAAQIAPTVKF